MKHTIDLLHLHDGEPNHHFPAGTLMLGLSGRSAVVAIPVDGTWDAPAMYRFSVVRNGEAIALPQSNYVGSFSPHEHVFVRVTNPEQGFGGGVHYKPA